MRILIADGDEVLLESLQTYLQKRGHEVKVACHGLDCIATLCGFVPDVLVLDYGLLWDGCDGILSVLEDDPLLEKVRVILIADSQTQFDAQSSPDVVDWLQKPFKLSDLLLKILSATEFLQLADGTSDRGTYFTCREGCTEPHAMLPQRCNPLRINTRHHRILDLPR